MANFCEPGSLTMGPDGKIYGIGTKAYDAKQYHIIFRLTEDFKGGQIICAFDRYLVHGLEHNSSPQFGKDGLIYLKGLRGELSPLMRVWPDGSGYESFFTFESQGVWTGEKKPPKGPALIAYGRMNLGPDNAFYAVGQFASNRRPIIWRFEPPPAAAKAPNPSHLPNMLATIRFSASTADTAPAEQPKTDAPAERGSGRRATDRQRRR